MTDESRDDEGREEEHRFDGTASGVDETDPDGDGADSGATRTMDSEREEAAAESGADRDRLAPMASLAERVAARRDERANSRGSTPEEDVFDELFDREDVGEIDDEALWERLEGDELAVADEPRTVTEVPKRQYCHTCEHFAAPPRVACTHEGTDILEMPTLSTFRVSNCPIVREERELGDRS